MDQKIAYDGRDFHKLCLKCSECGCLLSMTNIGLYQEKQKKKREKRERKKERKKKKKKRDILLF